MGLTCVGGRKEKTALPDWSFLELRGRTRNGIGQQVQESRWEGLENGGGSFHRKCRIAVGYFWLSIVWRTGRKEIREPHYDGEVPHDFAKVCRSGTGFCIFVKTAAVLAAAELLS